MANQYHALDNLVEAMSHAPFRWACPSLAFFVRVGTCTSRNLNLELTICCPPFRTVRERMGHPSVLVTPARSKARATCPELFILLAATAC
jgi:hypothetical protein